jgi:hypothetical protein
MESPFERYSHPQAPERQRRHLLDMRHAIGAEARQQTATVLRTCLQRAGRSVQNKQALSMARKGIAPETVADAFKSTRPHGTPETVRSVENKPAKSGAYKRGFAGGGSIHGPRYVIDIEVMGGRIWVPIVSTDGVLSLQTTLRPSTLVRGNKA